MKFRTLGAVGYLAEGVLLMASALIFAYTFSFAKTPAAQGPSSASPSPWPGFGFAGVGEALSLVPLVLVSFAWFYAGKEGKSGVIRATGVLGFVLAAAVGAVSLWFFGTLATVVPASASPTPATFTKFFGVIIEFLIGGTIVGLLGLAYIILEIITFFSAAGVFHSGRFRWAAWGRIISYVVVVTLYLASFALLISSITPGNYFPLNSTGSAVPTSQRFPSTANATFGALFAAIPLVLSVPNFLAFQGFRRIQVEPQPSTASPAPFALQP